MGTLFFEISETTLSRNFETILWASLVLLVLIFFLHYHWKKRHLYKLASKVPGPKGWPMIGLLLDFTKGGVDDIYDYFMELFSIWPDLVKGWYGPLLVFGVSKPEYLEAILTSNKALSKMYLYRYSEILMGHGLFTASVPVWKRHRKIVMPAFNQKILKRFVEVFGRVGQSTVLCEQLEKYLGKNEFDVFHALASCTLDTLCETAMGVCVNNQTSDSTFGRLVHRLTEIGFSRVAVPWNQFDFLFKWTKLYPELIQLVEKFHRFTDKVLLERRLNPKPVSTKRKAFLDLLLELSSSEDTKLTETELRDEVNTFMIAGSDTSANSLAFFFIMLAMHPHIQENVFQEVISVVGLDQTVEPQDLPFLKYTERAIKEALRLFPVGPLLARDIDEDLPLGDGIILPKGSSVILGIVAVHRNGNIWPNPLKFDPDRFLPEEVAKRHPYSYLPFSGGPRNCIGSKYAMMAMKTMVASVVRKFRLHTSYKNVEGIKLKINVMLRPKEGYKVSLELRK